MPTDDELQKGVARDNAVILEVLSAVERNSRITQRSLSRDLGIALGLANAYLKRCAKKGLIKVGQAPLNRYAYYLTPTGFAEKSRLTAEYLAISFNFFRDARDQCGELFEYCVAHGLHTLALAGEGELAEIAILSANDADVEILCVIDAQAEKTRCGSRPVVPDIVTAKALAGGRLHGVIVTDVRAPQSTYDAMHDAVRANGFPAGRLLAPAMLRITTGPRRSAGEYPG